MNRNKEFATGLISETPAGLPLKTEALAVFEDQEFRFEFAVNSGRNSSALRTIRKNGAVLAAVDMSGDWFGGMEVFQSGGLFAVRSHTRPDGQPPQNRRTAVSRWYLHPAGTGLLVEKHEVHSRPVEIVERWNFTERKYKPLVEGRAATSQDKHSVTISSRRGWTALWSLNEKWAQAPVDIEIVPDFQQAGFTLLKGCKQSIQIIFCINGKLPATCRAKVCLFGLINREVYVTFSGKTSRLEFDFEPRQAGLIPLLILVEFQKKIAFKVVETFVCEAVLKSTNPIFDGIMLEYLKGIHRRRIFGAVPEESSRGEFRYGVLDIWPRNLHGFGLAAWGFPDFALATLRVWQGYLLRDGFLDDSYPIQRKIPQRFIANDGIGFFLFCLAKTALRKPECLDEFLTGIEVGIRWLGLCTHWNGLLNSHCEAVFGHSSERTAGNPYPQSICMAGLAGIVKVLAKRNDEKSISLVENAKNLLSHQLEGFVVEYEKDGYFRDRCTGPLFGAGGKRGLYLGTYSALAPATFLFDPEIQPLEEGLMLRLRSLTDRTLEIVHALAPKENPALIPIQPGDACMAYCLLANVISLLHCGRLQEAGNYLQGALKYSGTSVIPFYLPEGIAYPDSQNPDSYLNCLREIAEKKLEHWYPAERRKGVFGFPRNHGNLVHMTYFLYLADVITGISHIGDMLKIRPKVPGWKQFRVLQYPTRFGAVSYHFKHSQNRFEVVLEKPKVPAVVELPSLENRLVFLDGKRVEYTENQSFRVRTVIFTLPERAGTYRIEVGRQTARKRRV